MRNRMRKRWCRSGLAALAMLPLLPGLAAAAPAASGLASAGGVELYEARVRPLLLQRCGACHGERSQQGGLRLDGPAGLLRGGGAGPVVVPGEPDASRLIEAVRYHNPRLLMPPAGRLPAAEVALLEEWVRRGAITPPPQPSGTAQQKGATPAQARSFWSFRPLPTGQVALPAVRLRGWPVRRADYYLLERMERAGLAPSPVTDRRTLARRAYLALLGLPPTPEQIAAFESDRAPGAYERLVEGLLASPHYGERWARHWLDLVRYCDVPEQWARLEAQPWLYRDWVVRALNADLPYPRFVQLQLAADELPGTPPPDLAALGFLGLSPSYWKELKLAPDVIKTVVAEEWEERITTVTGTVLALTVGCARCHDHKSDPVTQRDYYALAGVFASTRQVARPLLPEEQAARVLRVRSQVAALEAEARQLRERAGKEPARAAELGREAEQAEARAAELRRAEPHFAAPTAYGVDTASLEVLPDGPDRTRLEYRSGEGQDVAMQLRGNPANPGPVIERRFLEVLSPRGPVALRRGSGRADLAEALFREGAPLAARVIVNRVWRHHFGRGLVDTPSNFGLLGDRPSHPELLDDLAARFVRAGWSLKWLHREIMLSAAYRQSSAATPDRQARDPENRLLSRMSRRRLEVEAWRDSILSAAGTLDFALGGAPIPLQDPANRRRTLYGLVTRRELDDLLRLYDFPDPTTHSAARFHTITPLQQLYVLNSEFLGRQAAALAERVQREAPEGRVAQVERAHRLLYGRPATPREQQLAAAFLEDGSAARWQEYAEVLLARNEVMYVD